VWTSREGIHVFYDANAARLHGRELHYTLSYATGALAALMSQQRTSVHQSCYALMYANDAQPR
jgi:hypothetical protein